MSENPQIAPKSLNSWRNAVAAPVSGSRLLRVPFQTRLPSGFGAVLRPEPLFTASPLLTSGRTRPDSAALRVLGQREELIKGWRLEAERGEPSCEEITPRNFRNL